MITYPLFHSKNKTAHHVHTQNPDLYPARSHRDLRSKRPTQLPTAGRTRPPSVSPCRTAGFCFETVEAAQRQRPADTESRRNDTRDLEQLGRRADQSVSESPDRPSGRSRNTQRNGVAWLRIGRTALYRRNGPGTEQSESHDGVDDSHDRRRTPVPNRPKKAPETMNVIFLLLGSVAGLLLRPFAVGFFAGSKRTGRTAGHKKSSGSRRTVKLRKSRSV